MSSVAIIPKRQVFYMEPRKRIGLEGMNGFLGITNVIVWIVLILCLEKKV